MLNCNGEYRGLQPVDGLTAHVSWLGLSVSSQLCFLRSVDELMPGFMNWG